MTTITGHSEMDAQPSGDLAGSSSRRAGDRTFLGLSRGSGAFVVALIVAIAVFLIAQAIPALRANAANFFTDRVWNVDANPIQFGIPDLLWVTVMVSVVAMVLVAADRVWASPCSSPSTRRDRSPAPSRPWSTCSPPSRRSSTASGGRTSSWGTCRRSRPGSPTCSAGSRSSRRQSIDPGLDLRRRHRPGDHDPADRHRDQPRGLRPDAGRAQGGRARPGRHQVGDDPHRRAALRPAGRDLRGDARPRPRARRDHRRPAHRQRGPRPTWSWSIFTGGETFASRIANNAGEFDSPEKTGAYIAAGLVLFVLTFVGQRGGPDRHRAQEGLHRMSAIASADSASRPLSARTAGPQGRRHPARHHATRSPRSLVWLAFLLAVIPLVWILWTVVSKGSTSCSTADWWTKSQRGITPRREGGGAYHAIVGTLLMSCRDAHHRGARSPSSPRSTSSSTAEGRFARAGQLHGRHPHRRPVDRRRAVHLRGLGHDARAGPGRASRSRLALVLLMMPVVVRSTEEMLKLVPERAARGVVRPRRAEVEDHLPDRAARPRSSGIVTGVLLGLARVMGETAPLLILAPYTTFINYNLFSGPMAALPDDDLHQTRRTTWSRPSSGCGPRRSP